MGDNSPNLFTLLLIFFNEHTYVRSTSHVYLCGIRIRGPMLWSQFSAIFDNFRRKNWRFSQKPMLWSIFKKCLCFQSKTPILRRIFRRKYLNNHNIGPGSSVSEAADTESTRQKTILRGAPWPLIIFRHWPNFPRNASEKYLGSSETAALGPMLFFRRKICRNKLALLAQNTDKLFKYWITKLLFVKKRQFFAENRWNEWF
jgi:hypothetical protein